MICNLLFINIYRDVFANINNRSVKWDDSTFYLYICIIAFVFISGWIVEKQRRRLGIFPKASSFWIKLCFSFLTCILGLRGLAVGIDTWQYRFSFERALDANAYSDSTIEIGWQILNKLIRLFLPSPELFVFAISSITVFFIYKTIWGYRDKVNVFLSLFFYVGMYYFQAMNLMRIYLAMSILLLFFNYLIEKKYQKYVIVVLLTSMLHYSSLVMLLVVAILWLYQRSKFIAIISFFSLMVSVFFLSYAFENYVSIYRYAEYASSNESSRQVGIMLFFDYLPCFAFIYYAYKNHIRGQWTDLLVSATLVAFLMRYVAYFITIAGRLGIHFGFLYILIIPYFVNHMRVYHRKVYPLTLLFLFIFALLKIHLYFLEYLATDGIMPYEFVWNE